MAPKALLERLAFRRKTVPTPASNLSVLDLPVADYDKTSQLPSSIQVGGRAVKPFVSVSEGMSGCALAPELGRRLFEIVS